jgi:hypothetical protein
MGPTRAWIMSFDDFKKAVESELKKKPAGATWSELKKDRRLPYDRPCPEWTRRLEKEIGLVRRKGGSRSLVWCLGK